MRVTPASLLVLPPHRNSRLFSDHYLNDLFPETEYWEPPDDYPVIFRKVAEMVERWRRTAHLRNESQLEDEFLRPLLNFMGHVYAVQERSGGDRPDYLFYGSQAAKQESIQADNAYLRAVAIGDAKEPQAKLDRRTRDNTNPMVQIRRYLRDFEIDWAVLTNGRFWRLVHRSTARRLDTYYEVDLFSLTESLDDVHESNFRYFYLFFRPQAFLPWKNAKTWLDHVLEASTERYEKVEEDLRDRAFSVLETIMQRFAVDNKLSVGPIQNQIQQTALTLLYRFLFVLYAESRELLPTWNRAYLDNISLRAVRRKLETAHDTGVFNQWAALLQLFQAIHEGNVDLEVPEYDGDLFNPSMHKALTQWRISDEGLKEILDELTRIPDRPQALVDYGKEFGVAQLGSIYEGLLEFRVVTADRPLRKAKEGKNVVAYEECRPGETPDVPAGLPYLILDRQMRKSSGSYYTPEYIVQYMVNETIGPLCESRTYEALLQLRILDPACGSGHFLVGAVDRIAEELATRPNSTAPTEEEDEIGYWRRRVVECCVFGVDVNPMAVELTKLSLWLHTLSKGKILSFLNHHIKCGNSLAGADVADLGKLPRKRKDRLTREAERTHVSQPDVIAHSYAQAAALAVGEYVTIERMSTLTRGDVEEKHKFLAQAEQHLHPTKVVANCWLLFYLKNEIKEQDYTKVLNAMQGRNLKPVADEGWFKRAQQLADLHRFFHWEAEFPEVWRDRQGSVLENPGFDAVLGNPPYLGVAVGRFDEDTKSLYKALYGTASRNWDLFALFVERALSLRCAKGAFAFILPERCGTNRDLITMRKLLYDAGGPTCFAWAGKAFPDAEVRAAIIIDVPTERQGEVRICDLDRSGIHNEKLMSTSFITSLPDKPLNHRFSPHAETILRRISASTTPFRLFRGLLVRGMECGRDDPNLSGAPGPDLVPVVTGESVHRYCVDPEWLFIRLGLSPKARYKDPAIFELVPKVLVRRVAEVPICSVDTIGFANTKGVYNAVAIRKDTSVYFVVACMNSSLIAWWFKQVFSTEEDVFPQIPQYQIDELPLPLIRCASRKGVPEQLEHISGVVSDAINTGDHSRLVTFLRSLYSGDEVAPALRTGVALAAQDKYVATVYDMLARLAERMTTISTELIDLKHRFLDYMGSFLRGEETPPRIRFDRLKFPGKSLVSSFETHSFEELLDSVRARAARSCLRQGVNPMSTHFNHAIEEAYRLYMSKIIPLKQEFDNTDRLVDRLVYELYGLTEDEVAIVEGFTSQSC